MLGDGEEMVRKQVSETLVGLGTDSIPKVVEKLSASELQVRLQAIHTLSLFGKRAVSQGVVLLDAWGEEKEDSVKNALLTALVEIGAETELVVPMLIEALLSESEEAQEMAVNALLSVRDAPHAVVPHLAVLLSHHDETVRIRTGDLLERLGSDANRAAYAVIHRLKEKTVSRAESDQLSQALISMGPDSLPEVGRYLSEIPLENLTADHWAIQCVEKLAPTVPAKLASQIKDASPAMQFALLRALRHVRRPESSLKTFVRKSFSHDNAKIRQSAVESLSVVRLPERAWINFLYRSLGDTSADVRASAISTLDESPMAKKDRLPRLTLALSDRSERVQAAALGQLALLGKAAEPTVAGIIPLLESSDREVRLHAVNALGAIGKRAAPAVSSLAALVNESDSEMQGAVLVSLAAMPRAAESYSGKVRELVTQSDENVREQALRAYAAIEKDRGQVLPILTKALDDDSEMIRRLAVESLGGLGHDARPAARKIVKVLKKDNEKRLILGALRKIEPNDLELCLKSIKSSDPAVRYFACEQLGKMGEAARVALPDLRKASKDRYSFVRRGAKEALEKLEEK